VTSGPPFPPFPSALEAFVVLFNHEDFWESHEVLEVPWRNGRSPFYHGLILVASAFVHAQRRNLHGVRVQLAKAEQRLQGCRPAYLGVDIDGLLAAAASVRDAVQAGLEPVFPRLTLRRDLRRGDEREGLPLEPPPPRA
jgi:predicted metal-dependent hydrolase